MTTPYTIACTVHLCRQGPGGPSDLRAGRKTTLDLPQPGRVPRLARLLALAHRFDKLLREGVVNNFLTLARLGHVSPARISQIVSLLQLAPNIQEAILFRSRPERGRDCLDMRRVLPLTKVVDTNEAGPSRFELMTQLRTVEITSSAGGWKRLRLGAARAGWLKSRPRARRVRHRELVVAIAVS